MGSRLSVCIIAKNEQENLPVALNSIRGLADEVIVVDTGSTDNTVAVASSFGARTLHFAWNDDFSAAYNYCFEHAIGDWIFTLDADEELLSGSQAELRNALEHADAFAYFVQRQDLVDRERPDAFTELTIVRLWRNRQDVRYVGRIHSQFATPLAEIARSFGQEILPSEIRLRHYGYAGGQGAAKNERSLKLLEIELRERPGQFYYLVELGRTKLEMKDASGIEQLTEAAQLVAAGDQAALESGGALAMLLESILAADTLPEGFPICWSNARQLALEKFPDAVPLLWQLALHEFKHERFQACSEFLERILQLGKNGTYSRLVSFSPEIMRDRLLLNLGACYVRLARLDQATKCFEKLRKHPQYATVAATNLAMVAKLRGMG